MEKIKIEIKNRWTGSVLFEYECEENDIKKTVEEAVKRGANLRDANLVGANLRGVNLGGANLVDANLGGANLRDVYLGGANLRDANLGGANLLGANLRGVNLGGANLGGANIGGANLLGANLRDANLVGVNLRDANLSDANLRDAKEVPFIPMYCPSDGAFVGWKKVKNEVSTYLVKLVITESCKRSSATGTKCRCDKAVVSAIYDMDDNMSEVKRCVNHSYNQETEYIVGSEVRADSWDEDRWNECSHGIHFFINKQEAIEYDV